MHLDRIRAESPVVHNITNLVVTNFTANALLAIGASPIMAHAPEELAEIVVIAQALVLNIGTLDASWVQSMLLAQSNAHIHNIPIVLDPVGVAASQLRKETVTRGISIIHLKIKSLGCTTIILPQRLFSCKI
tara:strand:+ start:40373 stop:40768 length:396 start_codon:yes stop_codon:yes gene_type:complete